MSMHTFKSKTVIVLLFLSSVPKVSSAFTVPCINKNLEAKALPIVKAAMVEDDEEEEVGRQTEEEYGPDNGMTVAQTQNRFAATGILDCGSYKGTAQLTGCGSTITTAGHMFSGEGHCDPGLPPQACKFITKVGDKSEVHEISSMVGQGFKCPGKQHPSRDWAVLKLKRAVKGIKPYLLPQPYQLFNKRDPVINVSGSSLDFQRKDPLGNTIFPKSIENCKVKTVNLGSFKSTCDFSGGASGGSTLVQSEEGDVLAAIAVGNKETNEERERAKRFNIVKRGKFDEKSNYTYHIPLAEDFLKTVERANQISCN